MTLSQSIFSGVVAAVILLGSHTMATSRDGDDDPVYSPALAAMNDQLRSAGVTNVAIDRAELLVHAVGSGDQATTIIANDRTHLLGSLFVENDPRRGGSPDISYLIDRSDGAALGFNSLGQVVLLSNAVTEPQLDASVAAWNGPGCNGPGFVKIADMGADPDLVDGIVLGNLGLIGTPFADAFRETYYNRGFPWGTGGNPNNVDI